MNREQEKRPDMAEQGATQATPEDSKAKFAKMLEKSKSLGQEHATQEKASGKSRDVANADVNGLLRERFWLTQAAENRIGKADGTEQTSDELAQIQARMAEIDQNPQVMEALQNQAKDRDSTEMTRVNMEKSRAKAKELVQELPNLEAAIPSDANINIERSVGGNFKVTSTDNKVKRENLSKLEGFLNECSDVTVELKAGDRLGISDQVRETATYGMGLVIGGVRQERNVSAQYLFKELKGALANAEKVSKLH